MVLKIYCDFVLTFHIVLKTRLKQMSFYEEMSLYHQLRPLAEKKRSNKYRTLRNYTRRSIGVEPFNFDKLLAKLLGKEWSFPTCNSETASQIVGVSNVLDRFQKNCLPSSSSPSQHIFPNEVIRN
jgi:hypothetical protein